MARHPRLSGPLPLLQLPGTDSRANLLGRPPPQRVRSSAGHREPRPPSACPACHSGSRPQPPARRSLRGVPGAHPWQHRVTLPTSDTGTPEGLGWGLPNQQRHRRHRRRHPQDAPTGRPRAPSHGTLCALGVAGPPPAQPATEAGRGGGGHEARDLER